MLFYAAALQTLNYDWDTLETEPGLGCFPLKQHLSPGTDLRLGTSGGH